MPKQLILVLGGARSGKSAFAEQLARERGRAVLFAATATPDDEEMRLRIAAHRASRPAAWQTIEEPLDLPAAIAREAKGADVVIVDCLTLWLSNLLLAHDDGEDANAVERALLGEVAQLIAAHEDGNASFIVIANEVGLGLVPPYPLGRSYRDILGRANQLVAAAANAVYLLIAGIPIDLKQLAAQQRLVWADQRDA